MLTNLTPGYTPVFDMKQCFKCPTDLYRGVLIVVGARVIYCGVIQTLTPVPMNDKSSGV